MASTFNVYSNFYSRNDIVRHTALVGGKSLLIDAIRELFANDTIWKYRIDDFGFPLVPDHTNLPNEEGASQLDTDGNPIDPSQLSTKIYIGSTFHQDVKFYPAITVRQTSLKDFPLSFNQNATQINYRKEFIRDGYGNQIEIRTPTHFVFGDGWNQSFEIKVVAEDLVDRDHIADQVVFGLKHLKREELRRAGLFIKDISSGGEAEEESQKAVNKWLYTCTITVNTFSEWSREIPIRSIIERINLYFDVQRHGIFPSGEVDVLDNDIPDEAILIAIIE